MTNLAAVYGVTVTPAQGAPAWKAISVRRLSGKENAGRHNIYVKVLKANGDRDRDPILRIGWGWEGQRLDEWADAKKLDKPDGETGHGDVPISTIGQKISVWIEGSDGAWTDNVRGMHTDFPDEEPGNTRGHFSYEVIFQRSEGATQPVDPPVEDSGKLAELSARLDAMQKQIDEMRAIIANWDGD